MRSILMVLGGSLLLRDLPDCRGIEFVFCRQNPRSEQLPMMARISSSFALKPGTTSVADEARPWFLRRRTDATTAGSSLTIRPPSTAGSIFVAWKLKIWTSGSLGTRRPSASVPKPWALSYTMTAPTLSHCARIARRFGGTPKTLTGTTHRTSDVVARSSPRCAQSIVYDPVRISQNTGSSPACTTAFRVAT